MRVGTLHFALATAGCLAASWPSLSQQVPEVVVEAPHVESTTGKGGRELYSLIYKVNYADLNLGTHSGAVELEKRIKDSATKACAQLQKLYPLSVDTDPPCVLTATKNAMAQANKAIAAAEQGAK
jgi:UrcA family protein